TPSRRSKPPPSKRWEARTRPATGIAKNPPAMPAGLTGAGSVLRSEPDAHRTLQGIRVALEVRDSHAMAIGIFDAEVDKGHGAPNQVGMRHGQALVVGGIWSENVGVKGIPEPARLKG